MSKKVNTKTNQKTYTRQNGTVFYRKSIRIHGEKTERSFSRKADAERWYLEKKREKELEENGLSLPKTDVLVSEFADAWLEKRRLNGKPLSSWESD